MCIFSKKKKNLLTPNFIKGRVKLYLLINPAVEGDICEYFLKKNVANLF